MRFKYKQYPSVDAVQYFDNTETFEKKNYPLPVWILEAARDNKIIVENNHSYVMFLGDKTRVYDTDWIVQRPDGSLYVMDDYIFNQTLERVTSKDLRIKCAAIRYQGKIYEGKSHIEIGTKMRDIDKICTKIPGGDDQGFVTECGMFVMRRPAMAIAIRAGQVKEGETLSKHDLFSEDLK